MGRRGELPSVRSHPVTRSLLRPADASEVPASANKARMRPATSARRCGALQCLSVDVTPSRDRVHAYTVEARLGVGEHTRNCLLVWPDLDRVRQNSACTSLCGRSTGKCAATRAASTTRRARNDEGGCARPAGLVQGGADRDHARDEAEALGFGGRELLAREDELHGLGLPDGADEPLRAAHARDRAQLDLRLPELGVLLPCACCVCCTGSCKPERAAGRGGSAAPYLGKRLAVANATCARHPCATAMQIWSIAQWARYESAPPSPRVGCATSHHREVPTQCRGTSIPCWSGGGASPCEDRHRWSLTKRHA